MIKKFLSVSMAVAMLAFCTNAFATDGGQQGTVSHLTVMQTGVGQIKVQLNGDSWQYFLDTNEDPYGQYDNIEHALFAALAGGLSVTLYTHGCDNAFGVYWCFIDKIRL